MATPGDKADVFAIPDLWRPATWLNELIQESPSPFFKSGLKGDLSSGLLPFSDTPLEQNSFFKLPTLDPIADESRNDGTPNATEDRPDTAIPEEQSRDNTQEPAKNVENASDVWMELDPTPVNPPTRKNWDIFLKGPDPISQPPLMTEAGPSVYDAMLNWDNNPLHLKNHGIPSVESKAYFTSLLALALGQESILFLKQEKGLSFAPALPAMRISGYSRDVLQGLEKQCFSCGSTFQDLRSFVQSTYSKNPSRCRVALASVLKQVLKVTEEHVAVYGWNPRSLLELQATIKGITAILEPFRRLTSKLRKNCSDEELLTIVFHEAYSLDYREEQLREIMREVLRRVSVPWIEFVEQWIGTRREEGIPLSKTSVGESKGFVGVEAESFVDDFGQEVEDIDFRLKEDKIPAFMPADVMKLIFETGKNLRFIRTCHTEHPLARPDIVAAVKPPKSEWLYDWDAILQLETRVAEYRKSLLDLVDKNRPASQNSTTSTDALQISNAGIQLQFFGVGENQIEQQILESINYFNQPLVDQDSKDSLGRVIRQRLSGGYQPSSITIEVSPHWSLLPVLSFGGIATAQSHVVSRESLKLLFSHHDLRSHLQLHRKFHLFGNGMFCSRLTHALFDPDLETAERQAGVARQGGVMGLRLGGRDTWPPASSELRLALMGVLAESFEAHNGFKVKKQESLSNTKDELPGDLSFAVRDLSQEEIDKCMNPDSLEALDFLRLSYKAPDALTTIITPMILIQYDRIFKLLLRILRMLYVVNQLFRDINARTTHWQDADDVSFRFAREAHHFVSGIASYLLDTGVAIPWQAFESRLDKIEADLDKPASQSQAEKVESPDRLREYHSQVLESIMHALFLRKRQQPVLKLLEEIFNTILQYAKWSRLQALGKDPGDDSIQSPKDSYKKFKKKVQIFITVCRGLTEKGRLGSGKGVDELGLKQDGIGEDHMVAQLLMKLDMNDYYTKH